MMYESADPNTSPTGAGKAGIITAMNSGMEQSAKPAKKMKRSKTT